MSAILTVLFFCFARSLSATDCIDTICPLDSTLYFSSSNFPNFYTNATQRQILALSVEDYPNSVFAFEFYRFALGPSDCMYFCSSPDISTCLSNPADPSNYKTKKCGASLDHNQPLHLWDLSQRLFVFFVPFSSNVPYPGYEARVRRIDNSTQLYNECESSVDLNSLSGFYTLISDHFWFITPRLSTPASQDAICRTTYKASQNIRVTLYAFYSDANQTLTISDNQSGNQHHISGFQYPTAFYFQNSVTLTYNFTSAQDYYYYILISPYNATTSYESCQNVGTHDMTLNTQFNISALSNSYYGYNSATSCKWTFHNAPPGHQIMFRINSFTERCCDIVQLNGTQQDPIAFSGYYPFAVVFSTTNSLDVSFTTDDLEEYTLFQGVVKAVDCNCPNGTFYITNEQVKVFEIGNQTDFPYCSNINCTWQISHSRTSIMQVMLQTNLFYLDTISAQNAVNETLQFLRNEYIVDGTDSITAHFSSAPKLYSYDLSDLKKGFQMFAHASSLNIQQISVSFYMNMRYMDLTGDMLKNTLDTVIYTIDFGTQQDVLLYMFEQPSGYLVDLYFGSLENGIFYDWSSIDNKYPLSFNATILTVRIVALNGRTSFHALLTTDYGVKPYFNLNMTDVSYDLNLAHQYTDIILYQASSSPNGNYGMQFKYSGNPQLEMYHGLSTDPINLLYGDGFGCKATKLYPSFVFGRYVFLKYIEPTNGTISFSTASKSTTIDTIAFETAPGLVSFPTHISPNDDFQKSYVVILQYTGLDSKEVTFTFLQSMPKNTNLTLTVTNFQTVVHHKTYTTETLPCEITETGTRFSLTYTWECDYSTKCGTLLVQYTPKKTTKNSNAIVSSIFSFLALLLYLSV